MPLLFQSVQIITSVRLPEFPLHHCQRVTHLSSDISFLACRRYAQKQDWALEWWSQDGLGWTIYVFLKREFLKGGTDPLGFQIDVKAFGELTAR